MSVYVGRDRYIRVAHEPLSGSDINFSFAKIRAVSMAEAVRDKIISQRQRRDESIPIDFAAHRYVHIAPQMSAEAVIRAFCMLPAFSVRRYRIKGLCVLYSLIQIIRYRDISVGVLRLRSAHMQQALLMIDIPADKISRINLAVVF